MATEKIVIEFNLKAGSDSVEAALHDAAVIVRCRLSGIGQRDEFRYLDGNSIRVLENEEATA
jgi:hypothetical protein